ncbi:MAG: phasin family protein [Gammaproteobacteria bacterium]|nr:phasin family protein [Gammaproteobacteria bacterium]MYD77140.1 phasin family protein [Gammaproteobacteria bacterium]MYJ52890.1 phasin family protein [Gammaproteobacteria bacterium]
MKADQINAVMAPAVEFNRLVLNNIEAIVGMQVESFKAYAELGFKNLNAGLDVRTMDELKTYAEDQKNVIRQVGEQVTRDLEALGAVNAKFVEDTRKLSAVKKAA